MKFKKNLLIIIFIAIIINILLYLNNKQKTSFKYFIWNAQRVSLGNIINISFFSGLLISTSLNNYLITKDIKSQTLNNNLEEDFENTTNNNIKLDNEMPPERDIRDSQPTISVNYRVVKSTEDKNIDYDDNPYDKDKYNDDWTEKNYEW